MEKIDDKIIERVTSLYNGDKATAIRWLDTPNPAFGNIPPNDILKLEGGPARVEKLLSQLELGIPPT